MKSKKFLALLLALFTLSSTTACNVAPVDTGSSSAGSTGSTDSAGGSSEASGSSEADSGSAPAPAADLPEGVIPYTPYDLSGKSITVYTAEGELSNSVLAQKDRFTELTGCEVKMVAIPMNNFREKLTIDLSAGSSEYDAMAMTCEYEFIQNGWVEPLNSYISDSSIADPNLNLADFIPSQIEVMTMGDQIYGLPWKPDVMVYYYRKDWLEDDANKAAFKEKYGYDLAPAKTWEQYQDIAEFFTNKEENRYGSVFMGMNHNQLSGTLQTRFYGTGLTWYNEDYTTNCNTPEFIKCLEELKWELENTTPPGTDNWEWPETNAAFLSGVIAQTVTWPGLSKMCETPDGDWGKSEVVGKVGWTTAPGWEDGKPATTMGGWWAYISAFSKEKTAAYKFVESVTSQEGELLKISSGCDPARQSNFDLLAKDDPFYEVMANNLAISIPTPALPRWGTTFDTELRDNVHAAITGQVSVEEGAKAVDDALQKFLREEGYID